MRRLHREYLVFICALAPLLWALLFFVEKKLLSRPDTAAPPTATVPHAPGTSHVAAYFTVNANRPISILFAQLICIILLARIVGFCFQKLQQPAVVGEMIAGILLGPSLFGHFYPAFTA